METNSNNTTQVSEFKKAADALLETAAAGAQQVQQLVEDKAVAVDEMVQEQIRKEEAAVRAAASVAVADAVEQKKNEIFDRIEQVKDKAPYGSPEVPDMTVTKDVEALLGEIQEQLAETKNETKEDEYARIYADVMKDLKKEVEGMTHIEKESKQLIVEDPGPVSDQVQEILPETE